MRNPELKPLDLAGSVVTEVTFGASPSPPDFGANENGFEAAAPPDGAGCAPPPKLKLNPPDVFPLSVFFSTDAMLPNKFGFFSSSFFSSTGGVVAFGGANNGFVFLAPFRLRAQHWRFPY